MEPDIDAPIRIEEYDPWSLEGLEAFEFALGEYVAEGDSTPSNMARLLLAAKAVSDDKGKGKVSNSTRSAVKVITGENTRTNGGAAQQILNYNHTFSGNYLAAMMMAVARRVAEGDAKFAPRFPKRVSHGQVHRDVYGEEYIYDAETERWHRLTPTIERELHRKTSRSDSRVTGYVIMFLAGVSITWVLLSLL